MKRLKNEEADILPKRIKMEALNVAWEWEDDGHIWKSFSSKLTREIESAFKSRKQKIEIQINDVKFDVIFERMVQRNLKTFWERRIRANIANEDGGITGVYGYEDSNSKWQVFNHSIQRLIHAGNLYKLQSISYTWKKETFNIDLDKMELINLKTKKKQIISEGNQISNFEDEGTATKQIPLRSQRRKTDTVKYKELNASKSKKLKKNEPYSDNEDEDREHNEEKLQACTESKETSVIKSFTVKGKVPVDTECFAREKYNVYYEGDAIYDAMLNQTNLRNNNNKFYLMQLLQSSASKGYAVWFRWGRVGLTGQTKLTNYGNNLEEAKETFCKKFLDKTKNDFSDRKKFKKVQGKYDLIKMDYTSTKSIDEVDNKKINKKQNEVPESKLEVDLQDLIQLICDVKEMEEAVLEMKYDTKKAPLGKLTKEQIKAGYKALQQIDKCIANQETGQKLVQACDAFYTRVPHCFGMQRPPLIRTEKELSMKIQLLETLGDIEIAMRVINEKENQMLNPIDQHYMALKCTLKTLDKESEMFDIISRYTQNTHAKTHNQYKMEIIDVFEIFDKKQNESFVDKGNRMLLWHGSRLTNWVGILSQGLRIAPPEAPVTGYMFGKGVYFADMSSKSANYCYPTRSKNIGCVLLCEVSLGKTNELLAADYNAAELPSGCHSTKGLGKFAPKRSDDITTSDGMVVPLGMSCETGVNNPNGYTLNYNEYVVYNTKQIKLRYVVKLKFNFN